MHYSLPYKSAWDYLLSGTYKLNRTETLAWINSLPVWLFEVYTRMVTMLTRSFCESWGLQVNIYDKTVIIILSAWQLWSHLGPESYRKKLSDEKSVVSAFRDMFLPTGYRWHLRRLITETCPSHRGARLHVPIAYGLRWTSARIQGPFEVGHSWLNFSPADLRSTWEMRTDLQGRTKLVSTKLSPYISAIDTPGSDY